MADERAHLNLQESEAVAVHAASRIFAAYIVSGQVNDGNQEEMMLKSIQIAIKMTQTTDKLVVDEGERSGRSAF